MDVDHPTEKSGALGKASRSISGGWWNPALILAGATLLLHLAVNGRYQLFGDELYFIICGQHAAPSYIELAPLAPLIAAGSHTLFGAEPLPLRFIPALAMSATVGLSVDLAGRLGGGRFAQWLTGLAVLMSGIFLVEGLLLLADVLQPLTWLGCSWCLVRLAQTKDQRWWIAFGFVVGISLTSKYMIVFYVAGLAVGVLATPFRRALLSPWLYAGAVIPLLCVAPSAYWQMQHGWLFLEAMGTQAAHKNLPLSPAMALTQQVLFIGPAATPIWLIALWKWTSRPQPPELRAFPIAYAVTAILLYALNGKAYYLSPIYPTLIAGGAVAIEGWRLKAPLWKAGLLAAVVLEGVLMAPATLPLLEPSQTAAYLRTLGMSPSAGASWKGAVGALPPHMAGMIGWREMAGRITAVYKALPPNDRRKAVFFGRNYAEAGAIDVYGAPIGGPIAISSNDSYYLWGLRGHDGSVVITVGHDIPILLQNYRSVQFAGTINTPYAKPYETNIPIYILRDPKSPLEILWPILKDLD
jgi:4-amino-4-deoxy-L-arabinose transferase-like glycosyltransferase